ncbi:hypothetical protein WCLP8_730012 [uncultured Gammaproteobacteria bacterium]
MQNALMHKHILTGIVGGNEAEALVRLEPLHGPFYLSSRTGSLSSPTGSLGSHTVLARTGTAPKSPAITGGNRRPFAQNFDQPGHLRALGAGREVTEDFGSITNGLQSGPVQNRYVQEGIRRAIDRSDETKAFGDVEPFDQGPGLDAIVERHGVILCEMRQLVTTFDPSAVRG